MTACYCSKRFGELWAMFAPAESLPSRRRITAVGVPVEGSGIVCEERLPENHYSKRKGKTHAKKSRIP